MTIEEMKKLAEGGTSMEWFRTKSQDGSYNVVETHADIVCGKVAGHWQFIRDDDMDFIAASRTFVPEAIEVMRVMGETLDSVETTIATGGKITRDNELFLMMREALAAYRRIGGEV